MGRKIFNDQPEYVVYLLEMQREYVVYRLDTEEVESVGAKRKPCSAMCEFATITQEVGPFHGLEFEKMSDESIGEPRRILLMADLQDRVRMVCKGLAYGHSCMRPIRLYRMLSHELRDLSSLTNGVVEGEEQFIRRKIVCEFSKDGTVTFSSNAVFA